MASLNTITLEKAQDWAARWKGQEGDYNKHHNLKAFWVPGVDFVQLLKETGAVDVRAYLGVDENEVEKLMIVGVDEDGNDMINDEAGWYIYDFSEPCPNKCNTKAPFIS